MIWNQLLHLILRAGDSPCEKGKSRKNGSKVIKTLDRISFFFNKGDRLEVFACDILRAGLEYCALCVCDRAQLLKTNAGMQEEAATEGQTGK